ncbi:MAG: DUF4142 domain-containing protein [Bacteroidetes bacterium]|nr:DUF4142 domain-containing protein [Bacteroidota bacterium]
MKNRTKSYPIAKYLLCLALGINIISCKQESKREEDSKDIAEKFNDAKFKDSKEADFLVVAADFCYEEIDLARLAQSNASSDHVKEIATMMERDHTQFLEEIKKMAEAKTITLPSGISSDGQKVRKKLADKNRSEFDKYYCEAVVDNHKKSIKKYMAAVEDCKDVEVKNWAAKTLTVLRTHLDHAMSCSENFKESNTKEKANMNNDNDRDNDNNKDKTTKDKSNVKEADKNSPGNKENNKSKESESKEKK